MLAEAFNGLTLGWQLRRRIGSFGGRAIWKSALRSLAAAAVMGVALGCAHPALTRALVTAGLQGKWLQFGALIPSLALGLGLYAAAAWLLRCPELLQVREALAARRQRGSSTPPTMTN